MTNNNFYKLNLLETLFQEIESQNLWDRTLDLERNEVVKNPHTTDTNLYFIESGTLRIFFIHDDEEHIIRFGYQNNFVAALDSFISESPSELIIQTLKSTRLKVIAKDVYLQLINKSDNNRKLWDVLQQQLIFEQIEREKDILITSPKDRYLRVLKRSPQLFQEIPHKYIANYLRMSPETLSILQKS